MQLPASSEAPEYSRWDDDDADAEGAASAASDDPPITLVAGSEADGGRLDKWLAGRLSTYSRSRIQRWIADGHVAVDDRRASPRDPVWPGAQVRVAPQKTDDETSFAAEDVALDIVHEDDAILVLDKRAGLVVHPAAGNWHGTVLNGLLHHAPALAGVPRAGIVHRLDKDTSGLMVVAKTLPAQTDLVRQLQARTVGRTYLAIVHGTPPPSGRIAWPIGRDVRDRTRMAAFKPVVNADDRPGTKPAATRFETLDSVRVGAGTGRRGATASFVVCRLETGRTHQIRVHMQALGHPLVGDATYGGAKGSVPFGRQALHAWRLALVHSTTRQPMSWRAHLPDDLDGLVRDLGFEPERLLGTISND